MRVSLETILSEPLSLPSFSQGANLKAQVIDLLRTMIVFGRIPAGTPLSERELAAILGISRLPIREALQELEKEGLVVSTATNRRQVITLTERDIRELYEVRLHLELLASTRAASRAANADVTLLRASFASMEQAFERRDRELFPQADIDLHLVIWRLADNRHLLDMLKTMSQRLFMVVSRHSELYEWAEVVELHRTLVEAILAGDVARTKASMEHHMQNSLERTLKAFIIDPRALGSPL
jgi:DNA-binding GntR family transcriptional regulator